MSCQDYVDFFTAQAIVLELIIFLAVLVACIPYFINQKWPCNNPCLIRCRVLHGSSQSPPKTWIRCLIRWIQCITDAVVEIAFGRILKIHNNQEEINVYNVLKYKAPPNYTNILFLTLIYLIVSVLAQFWDDFLLQESFGCTTDRSNCCFGYNQNSQFLPLDCSNTTYLKNITKIICYKFVFELGSATGSAHGTISTIVLIICPIQLILLKASNGSEWNKRRVISTVAIQIFTVITTLVFGFGHSFSEFQISSTTEENLVTILTNTLVVLTIIMGTISFSMTYCAKAYEQRKQRRIEHKEQENESDNNEQHEENNNLANEEREKYE